MVGANHVRYYDAYVNNAASRPEMCTSHYNLLKLLNRPVHDSDYTINSSSSTDTRIPSGNG